MLMHAKEILFQQSSIGMITDPEYLLLGTWYID